MSIKPRYSIKTYIIILVSSASIGMVLSALLLLQLGKLIGFGSQGVLVILLIAQPVCLFSVLYGFYKGLKKYYGLPVSE